jgi:DnaJ-class molecular chaperone
MSANGEAQPPGDTGPVMCMACRGTGQVTSGLGGTPHQVTCPWCQGTGHRIPGIDAQEHPSEAGADPASEAGADPPSESASS